MKRFWIKRDSDGTVLGTRTVQGVHVPDQPDDSDPTRAYVEVNEETFIQAKRTMVEAHERRPPRRGET